MTEAATGTIPELNHVIDTTLSKARENENLMIAKTAVTGDIETVAQKCAQFNLKRTVLANTMTMERRILTCD